MIIVRTPYRVSFFGGGTDYEPWYREHGGAVLTCTIDKYCYIAVRYMPAFLGSKYRILWSKMETVDEIEHIEHSGVRGCLQYLNIEGGIEVNHMGDLPARSGLGSSSAFTVGMLMALYALDKNSVGVETLANDAIKVEQEILKETVGIQDQIECAFGGFNHIKIDKDGKYKVTPLPYSVRLEGNLMLFFTGIQRYASEIADAQVQNVHHRQHQLKAIADLVPVAVDFLKKEDLDAFGELLHHSWMLKRQLSDRVSNFEIDRIYSSARNVGALGGKLLGAGGGGFLLLYVKPSEQDKVRKALKDLIEVPFKFGPLGAQVMVWG